MNKILISTVTPVYSGAAYLRNLVEALDAVRIEWETEGLPITLVESIFVDDASIDDSADVLKKLAEEYDWVNVVTLARNFGQHPATIAGLLHTSGDWIVTLDEDLQHEPRHIRALLNKAVECSNDLVYAAPREKVHGGWFRDTSSRLFKRLISRLTGNPYVSAFNSFRLIRGSVARAAAAVCGHEMYLDMALCWFTGRVNTLPLTLTDERYQAEGKSGYTFMRLLSHARKLAVSSQAKILRLGALVGLFGMLAALVFSIVIILSKVWDTGLIIPQGWASTMVAQLFFGGLISFMLGILLEYLGVVLLQGQGKPTFFPIDRSQDNLLKEMLPDDGAV